VGHRYPVSNSVGRPLTTIADLAENWRDIMHAIYADGGSDAEVKVALAIPPSRAISNMLWDDLQAREPEFSEAIREGRILAEMWWQRKGREGLFTCEGLKVTALVHEHEEPFRLER
jgi:hypothetical protein